MRNILTLFFVLIALKLSAQDLPLGYITHFKCDFSTPQIDTNLLLSANCESKIENGILTLGNLSNTNSDFTPSSAIILDNNIFGDFISEITFTAKQTLTDSLGGLYIICGLRNNLNYYLVKFTSNGVDFLKMYKGNVTSIARDSSFVISTGKAVKLRIEREILGRSITIKAQGKKLVFSDPNLVMGYFGLGVEQSTLFIDKIILWAPTSLAEKAPIFN